MAMRLNVVGLFAFACVSLLVLSGCDDAPPYTGPALPAGYKKYEKAPNPVVAIDTSAGKITLELFEDDTPLTVTNFIELAEKKFYDGKVFHRIIKDFMIQGGCPKGDGTGDPGYKFRDEIDDPKNNKNDQYVISMANSGPNTNGSQFFIVTNPKGEHGLDGKHTVFGKVIEGKEVVDKLNVTELQPNTDKPKDPPKIISVTVVKKRAHEYKLDETEKNPTGSPSFSQEQMKQMIKDAQKSK